MALNLDKWIDGIHLLNYVLVVVIRKSQLSLSERIFTCDHCDTELDRDFNASLNLKYATEYTVLT